MPELVPVFSPNVCPRCQQSFACKAHEIDACQCSAISLSREQKIFINQRYTTCLCINCLYILQQEYESQPRVFIQ
ncbi:cysteine-rich CWC family protein [Emticicia fontis]